MRCQPRQMKLQLVVLEVVPTDQAAAVHSLGLKVDQGTASVPQVAVVHCQLVVGMDHSQT